MIAIVGNGGFAREVATYLQDASEEIKKFRYFVTDDFANFEEEKLSTLKKIIDSRSQYVEVYICIADSSVREKVVNFLPEHTNYPYFIHKSCFIGSNIEIKRGTIICPSVIITTNVRLGEFSQLNIQTSIGHDCTIDDYFTTAPKVSISGENIISRHVYLGTSASTREKIFIKNNVIIGLNSGVVKDIDESGVYIGTPAKKIK